MKISEILEPGGIQDLGKEFSEISQLIERDCQQYLSEVKKSQKWLYRGIKKSTNDIFLGSSSLKRKPKDSAAICQQIFDECLIKLGFTALRSNSIFAISDLEWARHFGKAYVVFPIDGKSTFTYTPHKDLVLSHPLSEMGSIFDQEKLLPVLNQLVKNLNTLQNMDWASRMTLRALSSQDSLMVAGIPLNKDTLVSQKLYCLLMFKNTYIRSGADPKLFNINVKKYININQFKDYYKPSDKNLSLALSNGWEVYITGEYYAVHLGKYATAIKKKFGIPPA